ncbi:MAG TPA: hypothetical protein VJT09_07855 [Pyrinomonadaceae bacterium]|nr:hypothetical protein [Pyrinomonadaceae bacterium]
MNRSSVIIGLVVALALNTLGVEVCVAQSQAARRSDPELLKKYVGRYQLEVGIIPISTLDVTLENETLWVKPSLLKKRRLIQKSRSLFLDEVEGTKYRFNKDADGNYVSLTFEYEGNPYTAERIVLPPPSLKGNTTFRLKGHADASIVALAGTFNDWNQSQLVCGRENDDWICRVDLEPGYYSYKFIVDGNWTLDPENPNTTQDDAGNTNNVFIKK